MIITCEACNTSFNLDVKMLKPTGSKVRCSVCTNVFTVFPTQPPPAEPVTDAVESTNAPEPDAGAEAASPAAIPAASGGSDETAQADSGPTPETAILDDAGDAFHEESSDLDFALNDETESGALDIEIEDAVSDALDDDLAGAAFEADAESDAVLASDSADESDATIIADLDEDDLGIDLSPVPADEEASATVIADLDEDDLDLDIPLEDGADSDDTTTVITNLDDDGLDMDEDFSLEFDDFGTTATPAEAARPEMADDLDDLDLSLDAEPTDEAPTIDVPTSQETDNPLDELSLDFDLETDEKTTKAQAESDTADVAGDELDLMLDLDDDGGGEAATADQSPALQDDLDLSGLEDLLKDDEAGDDDTATLVVDEEDASDLLLDVEDEVLPAETDRGADAGETLEDLGLDLEGGNSTAGTADADEAVDADQEIDLSEIEKMLEEPEKEGKQFSSVPEQDLELDIEASLETEKWMSDASDDGQLVKDEELDLSELEQVLEDVDIDEPEEGPEDAELELDLGDAAVSATPAESIAADAELDFDLSDFEEDVPSKSEAQTAAREPVDMELEFEVEEDRRPEQTLEDEGLEETVAIPEPKADRDEAKPPKSTEVAARTPRPKPVKKGMSKSLVFLLIIAILGGLAYGTYYLLNQNGIEIPYLSDYLKPKVQDPGNLRLTTYDINSRFVDNANVGKLFVITGKVKNGYSENRGMITLVGKIYSTGKVPVHEEKVYCGNVMSDLELANLDWKKIQARLSNRLGDNRSNVKIEPGKSIPFMVVFSGLPDDLEEFTIEVTGSTTLK